MMGEKLTTVLEGRFGGRLGGRGARRVLPCALALLSLVTVGASLSHWHAVDDQPQQCRVCEVGHAPLVHTAPAMDLAVPAAPGWEGPSAPTLPHRVAEVGSRTRSRAPPA